MDIVERLRDLGDLAQDAYKAAYEIERLRQRNAELGKALTDLYEACRWEKVSPEIDAAGSVIAKATGGE